MKQIPILILIALFLGWSAAAQAMPGTGPVAVADGDSTSIFFTLDLAGLDVSVSPIGGATVGASGEFILPITGGSASGTPLTGSLDHAGSGIEFEFDDVTVDLEDWEFDFDEGLVNGTLSAGPIDLSTGVFDLVACTGANCIGPGGSSPTTGYGLFLRPQAADFFENVVFDDTGFDDGDQIAWATIQQTPVPEPALLLLIGVGLTALGALRRATV